MPDLKKKKCSSCEGDTELMSEDEIQSNLKSVHGWAYQNGEIIKTFEFVNYDETTAFVNAVIWIAQREDHHPTISFAYRSCAVAYSTHAIKGISLNDFICAAKIDALLE